MVNGWPLERPEKLAEAIRRWQSLGNNRAVQPALRVRLLPLKIYERMDLCSGSGLTNDSASIFCCLSATRQWPVENRINPLLECSYSRGEREAIYMWDRQEVMREI